MSCLSVPCSSDGGKRRRGDILLQQIHKLLSLHALGTGLDARPCDAPFPCPDPVASRVGTFSTAR